MKNKTEAKKARKRLEKAKELTFIETKILGFPSGKTVIITNLKKVS